VGITEVGHATSLRCAYTTLWNEAVVVSATGTIFPAWYQRMPSGMVVQQPITDSKQRSAPYPPRVVETGDDIKKWLGPNSRVITNEAGDKIFQSANGMREVRFDFNKFTPHDKPHIHVIEYTLEKNNKIPEQIRIFFDP